MAKNGFNQSVNEKITPNPTKDKITISFENNENLDFKIVVFDLIGNKIYENTVLNSNTETISFDNLNLNYGLYFVHVYYKDVHKVKRIVYSY